MNTVKVVAEAIENSLLQRLVSEKLSDCAVHADNKQICVAFIRKDSLVSFSLRVGSSL